MKISENFDLRELVPKETFEKWGHNSTWFLDSNLIRVAEFYKEFWTNYYTKKHKDNPVKVKSVSININNWHLGGVQQYRGYRPPDCKTGGKESQHRFGRAFDCDIMINFTDGSHIECDYKEIHSVIKQNQALFLEKGATSVEDVAFAPTWLHTDIRATGLKEILVVKPLK